MGALLSTLFGSVVAFFAEYFTAKIAVIAAAVVTFITLMTSLVFAINALILGLSMTIPSEFSFALGLLPSNTSVCISAYLTARATAWLFYIKWSIVNFKLT